MSKVLGLLLLGITTAAAAEPNRIVYWGNSQTGKSVRVYNTPDAEIMAESQVKKLGGQGWALLENSTKPGFGAAICNKVGGRIQFYVAHGYPSGREAVTAAKAKSGGRGVFCSNALWQVSERPRPQDEGIVDKVKGAIRNAIRSQGKTEADFQRDCVKPQTPEVASAKFRPLAIGAVPSRQNQSAPDTIWKPARWCPVNQMFPNPSGVRG